MELEQCLNFLLTKAQQSVQQIFKNELAPYGVTPGQYAVLNCLWEEDGQTVKQLAERLSLDGSTMTGILDRMEQKELIIKKTDSRDRRALRVLLKDKGKDLKDPLNEAIDRANQKILQTFDDAPIDAFRHMLRDLSQMRF